MWHPSQTANSRTFCADPAAAAADSSLSSPWIQALALSHLQVACGGDHTLAVCQHEVREAEARGAADRRLLGSW